MDHFLHAPNAPLGVVRERILAAAPGRGDPPRRLYLSRRGQGKRPLLNEAELEAALQARGFTVIAPEELTVADQLELFRSAEAVVSPTGAALANVLFAPRAAKVFEIQPSVFGGTWVRALSQHVGARWHGYFCPARRQQASGPGAASSFSWTLPTEDFLAHLDAHL
jgi:capsular polysaccharide biosynthesis protein